jgi:hypothetical protein
MHMNRVVYPLKRLLFTPHDFHQIISSRIDPGVGEDLVRREIVFRSALRLPVHCVVECWHNCLGYLSCFLTSHDTARQDVVKSLFWN